jgi:hypothetical protein
MCPPGSINETNSTRALFKIEQSPPGVRCKLQPCPIKLFVVARGPQSTGGAVTAHADFEACSAHRTQTEARTLGVRGRVSPDRRSRKAREVRFHLVEDE